MIVKVLVLLLFLTGCGPSIESQIELLGGGGDDLERAKQGLLLAKEEAVPALLEAMEDPHLAAARAELSAVLVGLLTRLEDPRIVSSLRQHLTDDPDPGVRARICEELGLYRRDEFTDAFVVALDDTSGSVRAYATAALGALLGKLTDTQKKILFEKARILQDDEHRDARLEARIVVESRVDEWITEAQKAALEGRIAEAESLFVEARSYSPHSNRAGLKLGRFYHSNGQTERGFRVLRESGWLIDAKRVETAPEMDGRLDDEVWRQTPKAGPFYTWASDHNAAIVEERLTEVSVVYTDSALYFGAYCEDAHPESLIVVGHERDHADEPRQDLIEFFLDINFDRETGCKVTINSVGAFTDGCMEWPRYRDFDYTWSPRSRAVAHVGTDFWSVEYELHLGQAEVPMPSPGTLWGCGMQRGYRFRNWSQWTRSYPDLTLPESYGWLLFN